MKNIVSAIGCLLLAGCLLNTNEARVTADHAATIKRIGIVSLLGSQPNVSYLSTSAQQSSFALATLENWNADRLVYERVGSRLRHKGFDVVALPPTAALRDASDSGWNHPQTEAVNALLYETGAARSLDMIVVVYPQVSEDFVTKTNQNIRGYGFQKAFDTGAFAYATVYLEAIDVKRRFVAGKSEARQSAPLDDALWRSDYERRVKRVAIPAGDREQIAAVVGTLLGNALGIAAQEAGF